MKMAAKYNFFVLEVLKAWIDPSRRHEPTIHHLGKGCIHGRRQDNQAAFQDEIGAVPSALLESGMEILPRMELHVKQIGRPLAC